MKRAGDGLRMRMWVLGGNWLQFSSGGVDSVSCGVERNRVNAYLGWHHFFDFVRVGRILTNDSQCTVAATNKNASPNGVVDRVVDPFPNLKAGQFFPRSAVEDQQGLIAAPDKKTMTFPASPSVTNPRFRSGTMIALDKS